MTPQTPRQDSCNVQKVNCRNEKKSYTRCRSTKSTSSTAEHKGFSLCFQVWKILAFFWNRIFISCCWFNFYQLRLLGTQVQCCQSSEVVKFDRIHARLLLALWTFSSNVIGEDFGRRWHWWNQGRGPRSNQFESSRMERRRKSWDYSWLVLFNLQCYFSYIECMFILHDNFWNR